MSKRTNVYRFLNSKLSESLRHDQFIVIELPEQDFEVKLTYIPPKLDVPNILYGEKIFLKKVKKL
jgi:hypothetical protein